jgi:predicted CoA-substrate-specific enzyme activase
LNNSKNNLYLGLDLGSSYVKAVVMNGTGEILHKGVTQTGYDFQKAVDTLVSDFPDRPVIAGVTGYGRRDYQGEVRKTEISCLARGMAHLGYLEGTLVDIGGQDCKLIRLSGGSIREHFINRRCAAGTGSYLEFLAYKLRLDIEEMNDLARGSSHYHPLNSYCTVFTGTEILDYLRRKVPLADLIRGMYHSIVSRIKEMAPLAPPVVISGGVIAHHPILEEIFNEELKLEVEMLPAPQFLAAQGAAIFARDKKK